MMTLSTYLLFADVLIFATAASGSVEQELFQVIKVLQTEGKVTKEMLARLEDKVLEQDKHIRDQDKRIEQLEKIIKTQDGVWKSQSIGKHQDSNTESSTNHLNDKTGVANLSARSLPLYTPVAFQASISHDMYHVTKHQTIIFDHLATSVGGGYHSSHGLFTAPKSGIYMFSASILLKPSAYLEAFIVKNGNSFKGIYANALDHSGFAQGSGTAVTQLSVGDDVWVQTSDWSGPDVTVRDAGGYTTFMGCLIFEM